MNVFIDYMKEQLDIKTRDIRTFSPLVLAYIGDAVFELVIRTKILSTGNAPVHVLHKRSSNLVKAKTQASMMRSIESVLSDEELGVYKRGRNAKAGTNPKNVSVGEYRVATGFEALIGYLYLKEEYKRMIDLIHLSLDNNKNAENKNESV
jgi:ribonuclease-3 family protein